MVQITIQDNSDSIEMTARARLHALGCRTKETLHKFCVHSLIA